MELNEGVLVAVWIPYSSSSHLSLILSFLLLHSPTLSCWWRTCWSGDFSLLHPFDVQYGVYDICIFNFMYMLFLNQNPINSYVKSLHSHVIKPLVFMNLASILKEFYIIFVWRIFSEFYYFWKQIFILYMTSIFHVTLWTIYYTFHVSNLS